MRRCGEQKSLPPRDPPRHLLLVDGYIVEVQVHMEQIMMRKKEGHEHYGYFREHCRDAISPGGTIRHIGFVRPTHSEPSR